MYEFSAQRICDFKGLLYILSSSYGNWKVLWCVSLALSSCFINVGLPYEVYKQCIILLESIASSSKKAHDYQFPVQQRTTLLLANEWNPHSLKNGGFLPSAPQLLRKLKDCGQPCFLSSGIYVQWKQVSHFCLPNKYLCCPWLGGCHFVFLTYQVLPGQKWWGGGKNTYDISLKLKSGIDAMTKNNA